MARINLAKDPSLRSGTTAAFTPIQGAVLSITEDYAFYGKNALVVAKSGSNGSGVRIAAPVPVMAGKPYAFAMYSRIPVEIPQAASAEIILQVEWLNSLSVVLRTDSSATLQVEDDSTWYRLGGVWTAPTGATFANVKILQPLAGTPGAKLILDALLIEQSDYIGGYFDNLPQDQKNTIVNKALSHVPQVINGVKLGADVILNDLVLNTIDEDDTVWVVTDIDGWWGQTNPELPDIPRGTEDGSYDVEGRLTARTITVSGFFIPKNAEDALSKSTNRLVEALNLVRKGGWLHANEEPTKAAWVRLAGKPVINTINARGRTTFQVTLRAGDPIKYHWNDADPEGYTTGEYRSADIPDYNLTNYLTNPSAELTSGTVDVVTNVLTNPDFETAGSAVVVRSNYATNPDFETAGAATVVRSNYVTNPDFETAGSTIVLRSNRYTNPQNSGTPTSGRAPGWSAYTSGSPTGTYAVSGTIQQLTTTAMAAGVGTERFGLFNVIALGSLTPSGTQITISMDTSVVALPAGVRARVYVDIQDSTNSNATRAHWDAFFDATTGRITGTATTNGTSDVVRLYVWIENNNAGAAFSGTATVGVTKQMIEIGPDAPFFDGSTSPVVRTNYNVNPRIYPAASFWNTTSPVATIASTANGAQVDVVTGPTSVPLLFNSADVASSAGDRWSASVDVTVPAGFPAATFALRVYSYGQGAIIADSGNVTIQPGQTVTMSAPSTGATNAAVTGVRMIVYGSSTPTGARFVAKNALLEKGLVPTPYFDGSSTKAGFFYVWTGTSNASTSIESDSDLSTRWQGTIGSSVSELTGVQPAGITNPNPTKVAVIQSTRAVFRGSKSARLIPLPGATGDEYIQIDVPAGARSGGTAIANRYQEAPITIQAGSFAARALRAVVYTPEAISPGLTNAAGWQEMRVPFSTLTSIYQVRLYHGGLYNTGDVWWDLATLTEGNYTGPYFDGASQPILRSNLATKPQADASTGWLTNNGTLYPRTFDSVGGRRSGAGAARFTRAATGLNTSIASAYGGGNASWGVAGRVAVLPGQQIVVSAYSKCSVAFSTAIAIRCFNSADVQVGTDIGGSGINGAAGDWVRPYVSFTVPAGVTNIGIANHSINTQSGNAVGGEIAWMTDAQYEVGTVPTAFFDGSTVQPGYTYAFIGTANASPSTEIDADFSVRWQGTANASVSELTGIAVPGITAANGVAVRSSRWSKRGTYSARVIANHPTNYSYIEYTGTPAPVGAVTARASIYFEQSYTGATRPRTIGVGYNAGNPNGLSTSAPNVPGQYDLATTATLVNAGRFLLFSDTKQGDPDVWFDLALLTEGNYTGPYFDGSTQPILRTNVLLPNSTQALVSTITTGVSYLGDTWTRVTPNDTGSLRGIRHILSLSNLSNGQTYRWACEVANDGPSAVTISMDWCDVSPAATFTIQPGERRIVGLNASRATYDATYRFADLAINTTTQQSILFRTPMVEATTEATLPFDGNGVGVPQGYTAAFTGSVNNSPANLWDADFSTRWTGTANASTSELYGTAPAQQFSGSAPANINGAAGIQSSRWVDRGSKSLRVIAGPTNSDNGYQMTGYNAVSLTPGKTYTIIGTIRLEAVQTGGLNSVARSIYIATNLGMVNSAQAPNVPGVYPVRLTFTVPASATWAVVRLWNGATDGGDVWFDGLTLIEGTYNGPAFTGDSISSDPDFTYVWTGTPGASTSALRGIGVTNWTATAGRAVATSYTPWSNTRSKSVAITPVGQGNFSTYVEQTVSSFVPGNVYTVYGVVRVPAALTGSLSPFALGFWVIGAGNQNPTVTYSAMATNAPGVYEVRGTFTALLASHGIRFMNGSLNIAEPVQWDSMGVFDGDYKSTYFDGSTQNDSRHIYTWTGAPDLSTSKFVGWDEDIVTNIGTAEVSGIFTITGPVGAGTKIHNATTDETMTLQEPLRGAGMAADAYEVSSKDQIATIKTTAPHNLRVGDEVSLLGMVIPFSESDATRIVTHVSDVFPYSFSFNMPTDDIDAMSTTGQVYLVNNDVLVVDTYTRSVTYNGEVSGHRYRLTTLTDWIHFGPGDNIIEYLDDVTDVEVISKQISNNIVTLKTEDTHYFIPGEEINVNLPVDKPLAKKSLTGNVVTLTTAVPHGYAVGDVVDVASTETSTVITKSRTSNVATLTTSAPHGISASDTVQVNLPATSTPMQKQITSNVATLTTQQAHGFSVGDSVTVALPTAATITNKQLSSGQVILTTAATHNFSVGDSITVTLPSAASVVGKARSGTQVVITTSAAHGFSVSDQVIVALPTSATPTGNFAGAVTNNLVTVTTSAAHGFSVGDRILIAGSTRPAYNGEKIVETTPSGTTFTFRDWTLTGDLNTAVGSSTITNLTNQSYNGTKTVISASGTTFAYNL